MKYTLLSTENEQKLAIVDHCEDSSGRRSSVVVFDSQGKEILKSEHQNLNVQMHKDTVEICLDSAVRTVFPVQTESNDGSIVVATALGNFKILVRRGVEPEGVLGGKATHKQIKSSMPGKILKILCTQGQTIEPGQSVLIIEAMKMENEIRAPLGGVLEKISVQVGQKIETGELLFQIGAGV